jgi:ABC-type long-subunit fatty acid transport system fused permease/ATPase subunit
MAKAKLRLSVKGPALPRWEPQAQPKKPADSMTVEQRFNALREEAERLNFHVKYVNIEQNKHALEIKMCIQVFC